MQGLARRFTFWGTTGVRGQFGSLLSWLAGSRFDYLASAGKIYDNSVVSPAINWFWKNAVYPRLVVVRDKPDGSEKPVVGHELVEAFENGLHYDMPTLMHGVALSWFVNGNAYLIIEKSRSGKILGFIWVPWSVIEPVAESQNAPISYYEYHVPGGGIERYDPSEIVHLRWGIDPENRMLGLSPIWAALREVCSENELATLSAALPRNAGLSAIVMSPKSADGRSGQITPAEADQMTARWKMKTTGEMAGTPIYTSVPVDITNIGYEPEKLIPVVMRRINIERICVNMGIDPILLGFDSGGRTYSNYEQAVKSGIEHGLLPILEIWAQQFTRQILRAHFPSERGTRVSWDLSKVRALQEDVDKLYERMGKLYERDGITRKELKERLGFAVDESRDDVYKSEAAAPSPDQMDLKAKVARMRERRQSNVQA